MQIGFYFDQTRCTGCYACVIACKDWNDVPAGPASWSRITTTEKGKFPEVSVTHFLATCYHCASPDCLPACPVGAISKRAEDGIVVVDREACLGNEACDMPCLEACPYNLPQFGAEESAKMQKCDLCLSRWEEKKKPICVDACPVRALDAGPIDELAARYGDVREAESFAYSATARPSIICKPKNLLR